MARCNSETPFLALNPVPFATTIRQSDETIARASRKNLLREGRERIFNSSLAWTIVHRGCQTRARQEWRRDYSRHSTTGRTGHRHRASGTPPKHPLLERNYPLSLSPSTPLLPFGPARRCTLFLSLSLSLSLSVERTFTTLSATQCRLRSRFSRIS